MLTKIDEKLKNNNDMYDKKYLDYRRGGNNVSAAPY